MTKKIIAGNFSRNAASYDAHAAVQRKCAEKLAEFADGKGVGRILEIGCGTGVYTRILRGMYAEADIEAVDISKDMVDHARKKILEDSVRFKVEDAERMKIAGKFDLITSNASFQWFEDLPKAIGMFSEALIDEGVLNFSMYGPHTFSEFREVARMYYGCRSIELSSGAFPASCAVEGMLKKYFKKFIVSEQNFTVTFPSLRDFLRDIKYSGTRGRGIGTKYYLGRHALEGIERIYREKFGAITVTHHVYFCRAEKPITHSYRQTLCVTSS